MTHKSLIVKDLDYTAEWVVNLHRDGYIHVTHGPGMLGTSDWSLAEEEVSFEVFTPEAMRDARQAINKYGFSYQAILVRWDDLEKSKV